MRFKTLIAVAVAGAFSVPFAALAQGTGGSTTAPSATHPQGNPPASAPAGSQTSGTGATGEGNASWTKLDKNKDGYLSREELKGDNALSSRFTEMDKDNDGRISKEEFNAASSGAGATGSSTSSEPSSTMGTPKSPSSGGASSGSSTSKEPK
jgi:hypothetical protein